MKRVVITCFMMLAAIAFMIVHGVMIHALDKEVDASYSVISKAYDEEDFAAINAELSRLKDVWDKKQTWAGMTIDTEQNEEIEISLMQCIRYAEIEDKEDFIGEYVLFNQQIKHLPFYERVSLSSLF